MKLVIAGKTVEIADETISKALADKVESIDVKVDDLVIRSTEEDTTYAENLRREGLTTGTEIGRKDVLKVIGIEGGGAHKSTDSVVSSLNKWKDDQVATALTDAKIEPNKQIETLTADIQKLRSNLELATKEKETIEANHNTYVKKETIKSTLMGLIPDNVAIPKEDVLLIMSNRIKTDIDENGQMFAIGADGQPIKNPTTLAPLPIKDVVTGFFDQNTQYLKKAEGGAGGLDSGGAGGKQSLEAFTKEMQDKGIAINGDEFVKELGDRQKAGTIEI